MDAVKVKRESLSKNVIWLSVASLFNDMSGEIVARALPLFLAGVLGVGYSMIGLIEGVADTTSSLLKVFVGRYSDRAGSRKLLALSGYALTAIARPLLFLANSWVIPLVSRFVDRAGKGIRTAPRDALIADSASPQARGKAFGFHRAMDPLGAVFGALIGAGIIYWMQPTTGQGQSTELSAHIFHILIIVSAIPTVLSCVAIWYFVKDTPRTPPGALTGTRSFGSAGGPRFKRLLVVLVIFTLGQSSDAFLILRATSGGVTPAGVFLLIACFNLVTAFSAYPAGLLSDKFSRRSIIRAGWLLYALLYIGFAFADSQLMIWVLFIAYGLYYGLTEGASNALVADLVPSEKRGTAYGLFNAATGLAALPASLIAGMLWQKVGIAAPFLFGGVMSIIGWLGLGWVAEKRVPQE